MDSTSSYAQQAGNSSIFGRFTMNPGIARTGLFRDDGMESTKRAATSEILMNFSGQGVPSQYAESASELWQGQSHRDRSRQMLTPREFIAAPFFGVGTQPQDIGQQSQLFLDKSHRTVKSQTGISDRKTTYFEAPLIAPVRQDLTLDSRFAFNQTGADTRHVFVRRLS